MPDSRACGRLANPASHTVTAAPRLPRYIRGRNMLRSADLVGKSISCGPRAVGSCCGRWKNMVFFDGGDGLLAGRC